MPPPIRLCSRPAIRSRPTARHPSLAFLDQAARQPPRQALRALLGVRSSGGRACSGLAQSGRGWVASSGTMDYSVVRDAIAQILDGGVEALQLRQKKHGF